ncbi:GGDEF domain-containing protein [Zavarzinia aquatilis]|nr:GGDEF domain-containing protein [Zavarzinia aquatilis]
MLEILHAQVESDLRTLAETIRNAPDGSTSSGTLSPMVSIAKSRTEVPRSTADICTERLVQWLDGQAQVSLAEARTALAGGVCRGAAVVVTPEGEGGAFTVLRALGGDDRSVRVEATTIRQSDITGIRFLLSNPAMMGLAISISLSAGLFGYFLRRSQYRAYVNIRQQAFTDELSGALRREQFLANVRQTVDRVHEMGGTVSLLAIDLDHFKSINDSFGHGAGDEVIRSCGRLLSAAVRDGDIVGRVGGEEFAILLPNLPKYIAAEVADRLRKQMASHAFCFDGRDLFVTMSTGVASLMSTDSIEALMDRADRRLYLAKAHGRNCVVWEDDDNHDY